MKKKTLIELAAVGLIGWVVNQEKKEKENAYESGRQAGIAESKNKILDEEDYLLQMDSDYEDTRDDILLG